LFFFVFFPKLYYSFRVRKLKLDFLFDKYVSSEYKINFYNFFFRDYSEKFAATILNFLRELRLRYSISLNSGYKKFKMLVFVMNTYMMEALYIYWSKGVSLNFSSFLNSTFFYDRRKFYLISKFDFLNS